MGHERASCGRAGAHVIRWKALRSVSRGPHDGGWAGGREPRHAGARPLARTRARNGCHRFAPRPRTCGPPTSRPISPTSMSPSRGRSQAPTRNRQSANARRCSSIRSPPPSERSTSKASTSPMKRLQRPSRRVCANPTDPKSSSSRRPNAMAGSSKTRWVRSATTCSGSSSKPTRTSGSGWSIQRHHARSTC
jgi:hypothetical protein